MAIRTFSGSLIFTILALAAAFWFGGPTMLALVAILAVLEISLSFDNAVINAGVLSRMSVFWQKIFLTIGIAIAVFGMRLVFPFVLVSASAGISPAAVVDLAINDPETYKNELLAAHPAIAAFGGIFLLMIFLDFVFEEREISWLAPIEKALGKVGKLDQLSVVIALGALLLVAETLAPDPVTVLVAGMLGLLTYLLVNGLGELFSNKAEDEEEAQPSTAGAKNGVALAVGKQAFFLFLYLEVLDASFSFDGVVGAFAVTSDPFVIALGLGVGAMYVRSLTVYLVNKGTLQEYVYLEHGAHWAIGALAVILMITMKYHLNEIITGLSGVVCIAAAFISSVVRNRRLAAAQAADDDPDRELVSA
ncbi:hypothetical protein Cme02nite_55210 [Catellatospora methionotrophica]|uniref:DUF475 domain-containing protein n=1 Tax=Catellatospora methionotrophica TaxID=121620 RepID=A0A8J3LEH6_9ACTN|nr:DUF475 domain-containing protein [Catellatospora methionotrophica]GIG17189.1 hypothetical protein Cme02nite_55210 [Catellatospora methionotrophica]